jgi:hypothetical protein
MRKLFAIRAKVYFFYFTEYCYFSTQWLVEVITALPAQIPAHGCTCLCAALAKSARYACLSFSKSSTRIAAPFLVLVVIVAIDR